jgi:hydroxymethylbilane synthase
MKILRVGARGSRLSVWQAEFAIDRLRRHGVSAQLCILSSSGDRDQDSPIEELPGDAPFVDDLQQALRAGEIDAAVHSLKDMAVEGPDDLVVSAILPRGSITESLVSKDGVAFRDLPGGAIVGTSSPQLLHLRPTSSASRLRPVDDRVRQVRGGAFDAAILATVGLERQGLSNQIAETFALKAFAPAAGRARSRCRSRERS